MMEEGAGEEKSRKHSATWPESRRYCKLSLLERSVHKWENPCAFCCCRARASIFQGVKMYSSQIWHCPIALSLGALSLFLFSCIQLFFSNTIPYSTWAREVQGSFQILRSSSRRELGKKKIFWYQQPCEGCGDGCSSTPEHGHLALSILMAKEGRR